MKIHRFVGKMAGATLKFFRPTEVDILTVLTERMVGIDLTDRAEQARDREAPIPEHLPMVTTVDAFVVGLPLNLQARLRQALQLFQWCPILFIGKLRPFTQLAQRDAETYIQSWALSRFALRRRLFRGLRDLAFLGYYSQSVNHACHTSNGESEER